MAFQKKALVLISQAAQASDTGYTGKTLRKYQYDTTEAFAAVANAGFFNDARNILQVGDQIIVSCASNKGGIYNVSAVPASGDVTVVASVLS